MNRKHTLVTGFILALAVALASLVPAATIAGPPPGELASPSLVAVYYDSQAELNAVAAEYDVWYVNRQQGYAEVALRPDEFATLAQAGYRMNVLRELDSSILAALDPQFHFFDDYVYNSYGRYIVNFLQDTNAAYPDLTELMDVGDAWLAGHGGYARDMWALRITNEDPAFGAIGDKPVFFLLANIHAREVTTPEMAIRYIKLLLDGYQGMGGYGVDADATWLVDHNVLYIMVSQNPDGRVENELNTSNNRRKNMDNDDGCSDPYSLGVDLNRNHSFKWGCCGGSSGNSCSTTYRGPIRGDEPETQAFQNFFASVMLDQNGPNGDDEYPPAAPDNATGIFITLHTYSDLVLWPWGHTGTPAPNSAQLQTIGRKLASYNGFTPQQAYQLYATDGTTDDWTYGKFGVASYTFEIGPGWGTCGGFFPAFGCMEGELGYPENFWAENRPAFLYAHKIARTPYMTSYGPDTLSPALTPGTVPAGTPAELTATVQDLRYGSDPLAPVMGAEFFIGEPGVDGTGIPMAPSDGAWGETSEGVEVTVDTSGLAPGTYYVLVHGVNDAGMWGPFSAAWLTIEPGGEPYMFIGNIKTKYRVIDPGPPTIYKALGRVPVFDENLQPVVGATVTAQWELPGGQIKVRTATTRPNGSAYFKQASPQEGTYTIAVLDVQAAGLVYSPSHNFESSETLLIP